MRNIVFMDVQEMKSDLKEVESITFSKHFSEEKVKLRGITEEEINKNFASHAKLIEVEDQGDDTKGHKYALLFSKSHRYDLRVIVSLKYKKLNVITAHIQNIKRRKVYEKWLGRRK